MQQNEFHTYHFGTIPKRLNDFFKPEKRDIVGRTDELAQVRRDLLEGRTTVLVNGIGGIGKTTIARKYVESYIALMFSHIRWEEPERRDLLKAMTLLPPSMAYQKDFLSEICQLLNIYFQSKRAVFLVQYGWLNREPLSEGRVGYSMHPLILDVAFRELGVTAEWAEGVIATMAERINYYNLDPRCDVREKRNSQPVSSRRTGFKCKTLPSRFVFSIKIHPCIFPVLRCFSSCLSVRVFPHKVLKAYFPASVAQN